VCWCVAIVAAAAAAVVAVVVVVVVLFCVATTPRAGPGFFYVGITDNLDVQSLELAARVSDQPTAAEDVALLESECEQQGQRLFCSVLRELDGSADGGPNPDFSSTE
jgi:hypothetical protein